MTAIDPTRARALTGKDDDELHPAPTQRALAKELPTIPAHDDAGLLAFAKNQKAAKDADYPHAKNDRILYLGMNGESAAIELASLGPNATGVAHSSKSENDAITFGTVRYELGNPASAKAFAKALGFSDGRAERLANVLVSARPGSRDELGRIAIAWANGVANGSVPTRLVVSGHCDGEAIYGGKGDDLLMLVDLLALAHTMPEAAANVEDLHLAGCNTAKTGVAGEDRARLLSAFPKLRTFWGYQGSSPLAPVTHLQAWERGTRGTVDTLAPSRAMIDEGVTVADRSGHVDGKYARMPYAELRAQLDNADKWLPNFDKGWEPVAPGVTCNLYWTYQAYQAALSRPDVSTADKATYLAGAQKALRLRYYDVGVREKFQTECGASVKAGYAALGGTAAPDFSKLSRKDALGAIDSFLARAAASTSPVVLAAKAQLIALRDLDPRVIDTTWCVHA
ncbi:hypothetical protein BH09MYX1_BH09MYX1_40440 [soil metagenome]